MVIFVAIVSNKFANSVVYKPLYLGQIWGLIEFCVIKLVNKSLQVYNSNLSMVVFNTEIFDIKEIKTLH